MVKAIIAILLVLALLILGWEYSKSSDRANELERKLSVLEMRLKAQISSSEQNNSTEKEEEPVSQNHSSVDKPDPILMEWVYVEGKWIRIEPRPVYEVLDPNGNLLDSFLKGETK